MSRRLERWRRGLESDLPEVRVCRGGDCGSRGKHPGFDHAAQLAGIRNRLDGDLAKVSVTKCLDMCAFSNVIVVAPGRRARDAGAEPVWVGEVLDDATTDAVIDWVGSAGVGTAPPALVESHRIVQGRRNRRDLGT